MDGTCGQSMKILTLHIKVPKSYATWSDVDTGHSNRWRSLQE